MLSRSLFALLTFLAVFSLSTAFVVPRTKSSVASGVLAPSTNNMAILAAKKSKEDLSYIESRDMTRQEMLELNKKNEDIMNMELSMMTAFSLVISLPILYLCWVAFFSD